MTIAGDKMGRNQHLHAATQGKSEVTVTRTQHREMTIEKVQQWIVSALICAVASFPIGALAVTSIYKNRDGHRSDAIVLCVMAGVIGVLAIAAGRLMHRINPLSPYILIGALPGAVTILYMTIL